MVASGTLKEPWVELWSNGTIVLPVSIQDVSILEARPGLFEPYTTVFGTPLLRRSRSAWFRITPMPDPLVLQVIQQSGAQASGETRELCFTEELAFVTPDEPGTYFYDVVIGSSVGPCKYAFKVYIV